MVQQSLSCAAHVCTALQASINTKGSIGKLTKSERSKLLNEFKSDPDLQVNKKASDQRITLLLSGLPQRGSKGSSGTGTPQGRHSQALERGDEQGQQTEQHQVEAGSRGQGANQQSAAPSQERSSKGPYSQQQQLQPQQGREGAQPHIASESHGHREEGRQGQQGLMYRYVQREGRQEEASPVSAAAPALPASTASAPQTPLLPPPPPVAARRVAPDTALYLDLEPGQPARYSDAPPPPLPASTAADAAHGVGTFARTQEQAACVGGAVEPGAVRSQQAAEVSSAGQQQGLQVQAEGGSTAHTALVGAASRKAGAAGSDPDAASLLALLPAR